MLPAVITTSSAAFARLLGIILLLPHLWLASSAGATTTITASVCPSGGPVPPTTLSSSTASPTTNSSADLTGTAQAGAAITITDNGTTEATLVAASDGSFAATVALQIGSNALVAHADDGCGNTADSPTLTIIREQVAPAAPILTSPPSGTVTTAASVVVSGTAEPGSTVTLYRNGVEAGSAVADGSGSFGISVSLVPGANVVYGTATNGAGTSGPSLSLTITQQSTAPINPNPPPFVPPGPVTPQAPPAPVIVSPSSGSVTSAASVDVVITATPGTTVRLYGNGHLLAAAVADAAGNVNLWVPLSTGTTTLYATASSAAGTSGHSNQVVVTLQIAPPPAPIITRPANGAILHNSVVTVVGSSVPGLTVIIRRNGTQVATVVVAANGSFAASVPLVPGLNSLTATVSNAGGSATSTPVNVTYAGPPPSLGKRISNGSIDLLNALLTLLASLWLLVIGGISTLLAYIASQLWLTILVLAGGLLATTLTDGLAGLGVVAGLGRYLRDGLLLWFIPGRRRRRLDGQVVNSLTGRPLGWVEVRLSGRSVPEVTGANGRFHFYVSEGDYELAAKRFGFAIVRDYRVHIGPTDSADDNPSIRIAMEPLPVALGPTRRLLDGAVGTFGWILLLLGALLSLQLYLEHLWPWLLVLAAVYWDLVGASLVMLATQPRIRWGRVVADASGDPVPKATVTLYHAGTSEVVDTYHGGDDGYYTLFAPPGNYLLRTEAAGYHFADEVVTVHRHETFLGFHVHGRSLDEPTADLTPKTTTQI